MSTCRQPGPLYKFHFLIKRYTHCFTSVSSTAGLLPLICWLSLYTFEEDRHEKPGLLLKKAAPGLFTA
ncbi:UNVERIFIED_ORG: hypothetical protein ABRZ91_003545 [Heyndrickxia coagulans]